jgi:hypothetical protein
MPREWKGDFVRISFTIPPVRFPVRWSCFCVMCTHSPGLMSLRFFPFMLLLLQPFGGDEDAVDDWAHYSPTTSLGCFAKICLCKIAGLRSSATKVSGFLDASNSLGLKTCTYKCRCRDRERAIACHNLLVWPTPHPSHHDAVSCSKCINTTGIGDRRATAARSPPGGLYGKNRKRGLSCVDR